MNVRINIFPLAAAPRVDKFENAPNELLQEKPYEPLDTGTSSAAD